MSNDNTYYTDAELEKLRLYLIKRTDADERDSLQSFMKQYQSMQQKQKDIENELKQLKAEEKKLKSSIHPLINELSHYAMHNLKMAHTSQLYQYLWIKLKNGSILET